MNMDNSNGQFDSDSLQRKADVLRARDIIPGARPYGNAGGREPDSQQTGTNESRLLSDAKRALETEQHTSEIPKFDLAEEIMAEHRRITAIRRRAPGEKDEAQRQEREAESAGHTIGQPSPALSEQEQIIAEIVRRDIERL